MNTNQFNRPALKTILILLLAIFAFSACNNDLSKAKYKDASLSVETRVDDLLKRMTLEEKVAQTLCMMSSNKSFFIDSKGFNKLKADSSVMNGLGTTYDVPREQLNAVQKYFIENTRLGIPVLFQAEALHGLAMKGNTSFPQAIAMAGTFEPELLRQSMEYTAREARMAGMAHVLCPVVDIARDLRWGRLEETYGEDTWLAAQMAVAAVTGLQGNNGTPDSLQVAATLKHFAGYGNSEGGINCGPNQVSEREFREFYLYPFEQAIKVGKVAAVMPSYNERDGIPSHNNDWLLKTILRNEMGFKGLVVSDWFAVERLHNRLFVAENDTIAAQKAMMSGVDMELPNRKCFPNLTYCVKNGMVDEKRLDEAVRRVLTLKFSLGLFDRPYIGADETTALTSNPKVREHALLCAQKSIVLLSNKNNAAPIDKQKIRTIAVIGPNAADTVLGGYSGTPPYYISVLEGIKKNAGSAVKVLHHRGCNLFDPSEKKYNAEQEQKMIREAVQVAASADVIVLALGGNNKVDFEGWPENDFFGDRTTLNLVGLQTTLIEELAKLNKPIYTFLIAGKPFIEPVIYEKSSAVFQCWYLGQETGNAIASVLFGDYNPAGRLTVSLPRSMGHLPVYYNCKPASRMGYRYADISPLFPFGYGLSYTTFAYGEPKISNAKFKLGETVEVTIPVKNTGTIAGDEVVQLYIRDNVSSVTRPIKKLKGFQRITLNSGEEKTVVFKIGPDKLEFINREMKRVSEPGKFTLMVGSSSADKDLKSIIIEAHE